jgi:tRNA-splicing ligase RtcB
LSVPVEQVSDNIWEIPKSYRDDMRVPARIFADKELMSKMKTDRTLFQAANVATLPGIIRNAFVMPDAHEGYGFPIGGVAAVDFDEGVISPGGVGYDINCGVRLIRTNLMQADVRPLLPQLLDALFRLVPSGVGSEGQLRVTHSELASVTASGVEWAVAKGYGWDADVRHAEEGGKLAWAKPEKVSATALKRGAGQLGTLGSGNHFMEIETADSIFDEEAAKAMGIVRHDQVLVLIHTGSRGFGHQVCSDYLRVMEVLMQKVGMHLPDRELAAGPVKAKETEDYLGAMACAANFAWVNRQMITHWVREGFEKVFKTDAEKLDMHVIYDVAHNIVKLEEHDIEGIRRKVYVHRKGATRAFPPGSYFIPEEYRSIGQPVFIPGSMGTASWVLKGTKKGMEMSFGTAAHGAGRFMSRAAAKRAYGYQELLSSLQGRGILVRAASRETVTEEAPGAYKDVDDVVGVTHAVGLAEKVVRMTPIGVVKG